MRKLTPTEFEEEPTITIEPFLRGRYRDGVHTLSAFGNLTLVDGLRIIFEKAEFRRAWHTERRELLRRLRPLLHGD